MKMTTTTTSIAAFFLVTWMAVASNAFVVSSPQSNCHLPSGNSMEGRGSYPHVNILSRRVGPLYQKRPGVTDPTGLRGINKDRFFPTDSTSPGSRASDGGNTEENLASPVHIEENSSRRFEEFLRRLMTFRT